jgi:hypothetical protein
MLSSEFEDFGLLGCDAIYFCPEDGGRLRGITFQKTVIVIVRDIRS